MKVILIHDTVAVVDNTTAIEAAKIPFVEIDSEDSKSILRSKPEQQQGLQRIFSDVMAMFGFRIAPRTSN